MWAISKVLIAFVTILLLLFYVWGFWLRSMWDLSSPTMDQTHISASVESRALVTRTCPTLCDAMDCCLPGSSVHAILQARILECAAIPFSRRIFPPRGPNPGLLHCRQTLYWLSHQESYTPPVLEGKVLTELPGKSQSWYFLTMNFWSHCTTTTIKNKTKQSRNNSCPFDLKTSERISAWESNSNPGLSSTNSVILGNSPYFFKLDFLHPTVRMASNILIPWLLLSFTFG